MNDFQDAFARISELSFTHLLCSLGCCNEDYVPIGGFLLLQVAEGIGFEDWARCTHRFRNICRLKSKRESVSLELLASDPDFCSHEWIACTWICSSVPDFSQARRLQNRRSFHKNKLAVSSLAALQFFDWCICSLGKNNLASVELFLVLLWNNLHIQVLIVKPL